MSEEMTNGVTGFCNDITIDANGNLYATVENHPGALYSIPIETDGTAGR